MRTLLLLPGVLGQTYQSGGQADLRGDESQASSYGSNDRAGTVDTDQTSGPQLTGVSYTDNSGDTNPAAGKFASADGTYTDAGGNVDFATQQYQDLGSGHCETTTGTEATNSNGVGPPSDCQADCSASTACTGYQTDGSSTCKLYSSAVNLANSWDGMGSAPASCMKKVGGAITGSDTTAMGCSGEGFVCDFKEISKMGEYKPKDFIWKVVDPNQRYRNGGGYTQQTLQCQVQITYADEAASGTTAKLFGSATTDNNDWFYVPMGQHNLKDSNYCDIEAIRRDFQDDQLYMNDTIHIRGETARLNNDQASDYDLIGEFFDLICGCMTKLSTEASIKDGLKQSSQALLTVMTSTGSTRELMVELLLFSDDLLVNEVAFPQTFPDDSQRFYFLARHTLDNDWDAKLQINKCIACSLSDDCTTDADTNARVIFYDQCETILGGPQERVVNALSWYHNAATPATPGGKNFKPNNQWAEGDKTTCPYAAKGFQKFRLAERDAMKVTCAVTACDSLPCSPCSRRRLGQARQLQQENAVDVSMYLSMDGNDNKNTKVVGQEQEEEKKEKKQGAAFFILLILAVLLALGSVFAVSRALKKNKNVESNRSVKPLEA